MTLKPYLMNLTKFGTESVKNGAVGQNHWQFSLQLSFRRYLRMRITSLRLCVPYFFKFLYHLTPGQCYQNTALTMSSNRGAGSDISINFKDYDAFGFDLDHTLAKYKLVTLFEVAYDCLTTFLVNERGYNVSISKDLHKYKDFICKGLFLDINKGNVIKLGLDGRILRATHGTRLLSKTDIRTTYGKDMKWAQAKAVRASLQNSISTYRFFENYFDCPGLVATARIIDLIDEENRSLSTEEKECLYTKAWEDTLESLRNMYDPSNFRAEKGGYFSIVRKAPSKFVEECSAKICQWLKSLKQADKLVFLLTSSQIDYASCLLEVCLGKDWQSYFDLSLFHSRKPGFFSDNNPFCALDNHMEGAVVSDLQRGGCYSQGNITALTEFLRKELDKDEVKVIYFGDNICSDCYPSKHFAGWATVLILEEMDAEGYLYSDGTEPDFKNAAENGVLDSATKRRKIRHSSLVTQEEIDFLLTDFWGPFLVHPDGKRNGSVKMNTYWAEVIAQYSDIAVPSLEYLAGVPLDHSFSSFSGNLTDHSGFHPGRPSSLLP